ncbi:MAG: ABC transporter permease [Clostridia bacterium]|nr:ABC transporter permease [Clostridia bacterium]
MDHNTQARPSAAVGRHTGGDREARRGRAALTRTLTRRLPLAAGLLLAAAYTAAALSRGISLGIGYEVIVANASLTALVATGATFIFTCGSFDLSLGANMLVSALIGGLLGRQAGSIWAVLLGCLGTAVCLSVLNSLLASFFNLPVFIMTIVMMNVYSALATLIITSFGTNSAVVLPSSLTENLNRTWFFLLLMGLFELFCCVLFYLRPLGRKQRFLGGGVTSAYLSGIRPKRLTVGSFALAGIGIGLAAFVMTIQTPTLSASSGSSVGMDMLIALVFGGMNMAGGPRSRMYAALLGALSMSFLDALMNVFVTGSWYLQIVKGILFVTVVFLFSLSSRGKLLER